MSGGDIRPDRHILLELDALLAQIEALLAEGDRARLDADDRYRWVVHRLWIAVGNEAPAYARLTGRAPQAGEPWGRLYRLRNILTHDRLPDIDEDDVWRIIGLRTTPLRKQVRDPPETGRRGIRNQANRLTWSLKLTRTRRVSYTLCLLAS